MVEARALVEDLLRATTGQLVFRSDEYNASLRAIRDAANHPYVTMVVDNYLDGAPDSMDIAVETKGSHGVQDWLIDLWALIRDAMIDSLQDMPVPEGANT